jgi:hypothetical protein
VPSSLAVGANTQIQYGSSLAICEDHFIDVQSFRKGAQWTRRRDYTHLEVRQYGLWRADKNGDEGFVFSQGGGS